MRQPRLPHGVPVRTALAYALFGCAWIALSDRWLLSGLSDTWALTRLQTYKGWIFVAASAALIYGLLRRELNRQARTEDELRDSTNRYRGLFEDSPVALFEMDFTAVWEGLPAARTVGKANLRGRAARASVTSYNRAALALYRARDGRDLPDDLEALLGGDVALALVEQFIATSPETTVFDMESTIRTVDDEERAVLVRGAVSPGSERKLDRIYISLIDVTERRNAEEELQQRRRELARAGRVLALGDLSASIAHELNQPLAAILSNAQAARRLLEQVPPDLEEVRLALADIERDDLRADGVIRQLREFIRRDEIRRDPVDINQVCRGVLRLVRSDAAQRRVATSADLAADVPIVLGDAVALQRVLLNLVLNALDAVTQSVNGARHVLVRSARGERGAITVTVSDTGPGVPDHLTDQLFAPFFTTKAEGLGLGLPLSRSLIEAHGGELWAKRNPEGGMTFGFHLPTAGAREGVA